MKISIRSTTIFLLSFLLFPMVGGFCLSVQPAAATNYTVQAPVQGSGLTFSPKSIDRVTPIGTYTQDLTGEGSKFNYAGFHVDVATPGFKAERVWKESVGADFIVYGIDGVFSIPVDIYTMTPTDSIAERKTSYLTWLSYFSHHVGAAFLMYNIYSDIPCYAYNEMTGVYEYVEKGSFLYSTFGESQGVYHYSNIQYTPLRLAYDEYVLKAVDTPIGSYTPVMGTTTFGDNAVETINGINEYQNLVMDVGYNPANVTLKRENDTATITFGTASWQVLSVAPQDQGTVASLGDYDVDYVSIGKEAGNLNILSHYQSLAEQDAFLLSFEAGAAYKRTMAGQVGWSAESAQNNQPVQVQQGSEYLPTQGANVLKNVATALNTNVNASLGYHLRPNVTRTKQVISATTQAKVNFRTASDWPWVEDVSSLYIGKTESVDRTLYVKADDNYIRQTWDVRVRFYSTVELTGIASTAFLGIPFWQQANMVVDASIGGDTSYSQFITDSYGLGDFYRDTAAVVTGVTNFATDLLWTVLFLAIGFVAVIVVYRFAKPAGRD